MEGRWGILGIGERERMWVVQVLEARSLDHQELEEPVVDRLESAVPDLQGPVVDRLESAVPDLPGPVADRLEFVESDLQEPVVDRRESEEPVPQEPVVDRRREHLELLVDCCFQFR
jgi:hypothetical protein